MARPRKPTALRIIEGVPGHRPLPRDEPKPELGAEMPPGLSPAAQARWPQLAKQLEAARILTRLDALALAALCEVWARWRDACDQVAAAGLVVEAQGGGVKLAPHWTAFMQASSEMRRMLVEFGMTPAARARVAAIKGPAQDDDPFADF